MFTIIFTGPEISQDLVQLLQKRLDDWVLDVLTVTLARNPMCKLTPEDVQVCVEMIFKCLKDDS